MSILDNLKWLLGSGVPNNDIYESATTTSSTFFSDEITKEELLELWLPVMEEYAEKQRKEKQARDQEKKKKDEEVLKKSIEKLKKSLINDPIWVSQDYYDLIKKEKQRQKQVEEDLETKESESSEERVTPDTISTPATTLTDEEKKELLHKVSTTTQYSLPKEYYDYLDTMSTRYTGKEIKKWYKDAMKKQIEKDFEEYYMQSKKYYNNRIHRMSQATSSWTSIPQDS